LERGDSYQPLVELMGGEMIEMSLDSEQTINPWDLPRGETKPSNDQISFLKNLTRHMLGENTPPDLDIDLLDSVLLEAIASTYKRCSAKTSNPIPLFGDLAAELAHWQDRDRNQKINAMAQMASTKLRAWVDEGPYARLFDRPTTVQLNNPWLYFNVEKLKDDPRLERAMSLLIAHTATYRASGNTGQPSIVLLDECWALLESPILARVVVQLFRTARKRNASVWGISQTPEDFVGTPDRPNEHGAGIVKNATTKIIGKQPGDMTALREHVHLNETALNQIKTFAHPKKGHSAEFLIAIGEKAESTHAIRIVPSAVDYWITTTYARERSVPKVVAASAQATASDPGLRRACRQYPRGLAELAPLPVELSGEVQEVMCNDRTIPNRDGSIVAERSSIRRRGGRSRRNRGSAPSLEMESAAAFVLGDRNDSTRARARAFFDVFKEIFGTIQNDIGSSLSQINQVVQQVQKLYQTTVAPLAALNQARGFVANSAISFRGQMNQIFNTQFTSAVTPGPQQFESILHSRLSAQIPALQTSFTANYGAIPQVNTASPQDRVMMDVDDALGQENLKTTLIADQGATQFFRPPNQMENQVAVSTPGSNPFLTAQAQVANLRCQAFMQKMLAAELRQEAGRIAHDNVLVKRRTAATGGINSLITGALTAR
jgi:hypothetical protein